MKVKNFVRKPPTIFNFMTIPTQYFSWFSFQLFYYLNVLVSVSSKQRYFKEIGDNLSHEKWCWNEL